MDNTITLLSYQRLERIPPVRNYGHRERKLDVDDSKFRKRKNLMKRGQQKKKKLNSKHKIFESKHLIK